MTKLVAGITSLMITLMACAGVAQAQEEDTSVMQPEDSTPALILSVVNSTDLTSAAKAQQVAELIPVEDASVAYISLLMEMAVQNSAPENQDAMLSSILSTIMIKKPAIVPQVVATSIENLDNALAAKVLVVTSILAPRMGIDTVPITAAIEGTVSPPKVSAIVAASAEPATVVNVEVVTTTADSVRAALLGPPTTETADDSTETDSSTEDETESETPATAPIQIIIPTIPNEIVGYGGQTTPAP